VRHLRFASWLKRFAFMGLIIGTVVGLAFTIVTTSLTPFTLIPLNVGFSLVLACISWPLAARITASHESRLIRIMEAALYGGITGAIVLMPFSEGWAMAVFQAIQGAFVGALLGAVIGVIFRWRSSSATSSTKEEPG